MRLPDPLGQPGPERALSEDRVNSVGKRRDLADAVAPRHPDQDRLVVTAGEELDLAPPDQVREVADHVGTVRFEPIEQRTREVEARLYLGMAVQRRDQGGIRPL